MRKKILALIFIMLVIIILLILFFITKKQKNINLPNPASAYCKENEGKVEIRADVNKDGAISREETIDMYRHLGSKYDGLNPRKLSISELERYLETKK